MTMRFLVLCLFAVAALSQAEGTDWSSERSLREGEDPNSRPSLQNVRINLSSARKGSRPSLGPLSLAGFNWAQETVLGPNRRIVVVSCNLGGGILAFDDTGRLLASRRTWETVSVHLFDFDEDGTQEVVTENMDGVGTGVAFWNYHVYQLNESGIDHLWSGLSYELVASGDEILEKHGFLRFVPSGWGDPHTKLVHLVGPVDSGTLDRSVYVFTNGSLSKKEGDAIIEWPAR